MNYIINDKRGALKLMTNTEAVKTWLSKDKKEAILILSGEYWLVQMGTKQGKMIGSSVEEAREILKELEKSDEFPDF